MHKWTSAFIIGLLVSTPAFATDYQAENDRAMEEYRNRYPQTPIVITPSYEGIGGIPDRSKRSIVISPTGQVYQTEPGSMSRDWNAPKPVIRNGW